MLLKINVIYSFLPYFQARASLFIWSYYYSVPFYSFVFHCRCSSRTHSASLPSFSFSRSHSSTVAPPASFPFTTLSFQKFICSLRPPLLLFGVPLFVLFGATILPLRVDQSLCRSIVLPHCPYSAATTPPFTLQGEFFIFKFCNFIFNL